MEAWRGPPYDLRTAGAKSPLTGLTFSWRRSRARSLRARSVLVGRPEGAARFAERSLRARSLAAPRWPGCGWLTRALGGGDYWTGIAVEGWGVDNRNLEPLKASKGSGGDDGEQRVECQLE